MKEEIHMTSNQIAYWSLQEDVRSHQAREDLKRQANAENVRTNKANEGIKSQANRIKLIDSALTNATSLFKSGGALRGLLK